MINILIDKIIQQPLFLQLKNIVENNAYHNHEDVYSHALKTKDIALREISGEFIGNLSARKSFLEFVNEDFAGMKRADILIMIALLHDIGKILYVKEADRSNSILVTDSSGITTCPGHEFWGSTIVSQVLKDLALKIEIVNYISSVVKLHDTFGGSYFPIKTDWPPDFLINDVKSRSEGLYKEALFNIYCDCFSAALFQPTKKMIIEVFNNPSLYEKREYVIR